MHQSRADEIALVALHHYHHVLPLKGKPKENEWTVYAAIVAVSNCTAKERQRMKNNNNGTSTTPSNKQNMWVVSCATGTKCCAIQPSNSDNSSSRTQCNLHILRDSHAEVLARRGFVRALWNEMIVLQNKEQEPTMNPSILTSSSSESTIPNATRFSDDVNDNDDNNNNNNNNKDVHEHDHAHWLLKTSPIGMDSTLEDRNFIPTFELRDDIDLHMYISDSPCGDASIYEVITNQHKNTTNTNTTIGVDNDFTSARDTRQNKFTGSKVIVVDAKVVAADTITKHSVVLSPQKAQVRILREAHQQTLGQLRTKSGRSNIDAHRRSSSMSCSDKLVRWSVLGLQGGILSKYIPIPIRFKSIIVGHDPATTTRSIVSTDTTSDSKPPESDGTNDSLNSTQTIALQRAIPHRVQLVQQFLRDLPDHDESEQWKIYFHPMTIPVVFTTHHTFLRGKAMIEYATSLASQTTIDVSVVTSFVNGSTLGKRKRSDATTAKTNDSTEKASVTGISINWHQNLSYTPATTTIVLKNLELIVGVRGIRHGKKPKCVDDAKRLQSQLCRQALWTLQEQWLLLLQNDRNNTDNNNDEEEKEEADQPNTPLAWLPALSQQQQQQQQQQDDDTDYIEYQQKYCSTIYQMIRARIFSHDRSPLVGWLVGDDDDGKAYLLNTNHNGAYGS